MFKLAWGLKVDNAFRQRLMEICRRYNWSKDHACWLMAAMAFESGETFSPRITNGAGSGAVGLIQFMPTTAEYLGTDSIELAGMTAVQQLEYVEKYFKPYASRITCLPDMYMAILMPKFVGRPNDTVIFKEGISYRQNAGLDANKDGQITKAEAAAKVQAKLDKGWTCASDEADIYP
jgi:hypothetical protein